jgi:hypothetical protein
MFATTHKTKHHPLDPKGSHACAVERIVRHLKGTQEKGLTFFSPTGELALDCCCGANFFGIPPICQVSKAKMDTCVLCLDARSIGLPNCRHLWHCLRPNQKQFAFRVQHVCPLPPLIEIVDEIWEHAGLEEKDCLVCMKSKVFEHDNGCITTGTLHFFL